MKASTAIALIILLFLSASYSGTGLPCVYSVCRIELINGEIIEGIITVGTGGYIPFFDTNGFLIVRDETKIPFLFDYDFNSIELYRSKHSDKLSSLRYQYKEHKGREISGLDSKEKIELCYLKDVSSTKYGMYPYKISENKTISEDSLHRFMEFSHEYKTRYELLNHIPIFEEIPVEIFSCGHNRISPQLSKIEFSMIRKFELLKAPSPEWLKKIASARENAMKKYFKDSPDEPHIIFFHEIVKPYYKDSGQFLFKPWDLYSFIM